MYTIDKPRKEAKFLGGDTVCGVADVEPQDVRIVRLWDGGTKDPGEDDLWLIRAASGKEYVVDGFELSPHPESPATVLEKIEDLLTWGHPLLHGFVLDALLKQAEAVVQEREIVIEQMKNSFIAGEAWVQCAEEVIAKLGVPKP